MRCGPKAPILLSLVVALAACAQEGERESAMEEPAGMEAASAVRQMYPNLPADVIFENDRVVAQLITSEPNQRAGEHSHTGPQLAVILKGGTMTYREGGEETLVTHEDGEVFWREPTEAHDHAITSGSRLEGVLLSIAAMDGMGGVKQEFPNIPAEIVFENDQVVAQRITTDPDQWAGEHSHAGGQVVVMLKGGRVTYREGGTETSVTYEDGEVFWIDPTEAHDHVVTSGAAIEAVLVTIK